MATEYRVEPLNTIQYAARLEQYKAVQPLCGKGGLELREIIVDNPADPTMMWGRLYVGGKIVGGILYYDRVQSIDRILVCVEQGKGYLSVINAEFEKVVLASGRNNIPIHLTAKVDVDRKVPLAHMLQGYKPAGDPLRSLIYETAGIHMARTIGAPLPSEEEKAAIRTLHTTAAAERARLAEAAAGRKRRRTDMTSGRRRTRRRKRFSTRRYKKHNG